MSYTNGLGASPSERRYRVIDNNTGEELYDNTTCTAIREYGRRNYRHGDDSWEIEWLSPNPKIGWQPMTQYQFERELRREMQHTILYGHRNRS